MTPFEWLLDGAENGSVVRTRVVETLQVLLDWALSATVALLVVAVGYAGMVAVGVELSTWVIGVLWTVVTWILFAPFRGFGRSVLYWLGGRKIPPRRIPERSPESGD